MALTKPQGDMLMKLGTPVTTTSGTAALFTGIPAGTTHIVVTVNGFSTNGTSNLSCTIGPVGGVEASGYVGAVHVHTAGPAISATAITTSFLFGALVAAATYNVTAVLTLLNSSTNTWGFLGSSSRSDGTAGLSIINGTKPLAGVLERVNVTTTAADTFDAGSINIAYF